jgi:hypothetical protein
MKTKEIIASLSKSLSSILLIYTSQLKHHSITTPKYPLPWEEVKALMPSEVVFPKRLLEKACETKIHPHAFLGGGVPAFAFVVSVGRICEYVGVCLWIKIEWVSE